MKCSTRFINILLKHPVCVSKIRNHLLCNCLNHPFFALISSFNQPRHRLAFPNEKLQFLNEKSSIPPFCFLNTSDLQGQGVFFSLFFILDNITCIVKVQSSVNENQYND